MAGYLSIHGRRSALLGIIGTTSAPLVCRLFTNRVPLTANTELPSFQEAIYPGYFPVPLNGRWDITNTVPMLASHPSVQFAPTEPLTTPLTVFGYYLTRDGVLVAYESGGPFTLSLARDILTINPVLAQT